MNQTLYIPAFSAVGAGHKARILEGQEPFFWRDPKAAHEAIALGQAGGAQPVVFAVTRRPDGSYFVREHIQLGPEHAIDPRPLTVGDVVKALGVIAIAIGGVWLVGRGTLS